MEDLLRHRTSHPSLSLDHSEYAVSPKVTEELLQDLLKGVPFQYLLGKTEFYGKTFHVNSHVLIPRPETEQMVDLLVQMKRNYSSVLDVGTGSGVILLSLLDQGVAGRGVGVDISSEAIEVAKINARQLRLEDRCTFVLSDRLQQVKEKFDLIVSNPPYIKASAHRGMVHQQVDNYEPSQALYIPDEEYNNWFHTFFQQIHASLREGGLFMMEGHECEVQNQKLQLEELGFSMVKVIKDWSGNDRFLEARL